MPNLLAIAINIGPKITMMAISSITAASKKNATFKSSSITHFCWMLSPRKVAILVASCSCATSTPKPPDTAMMAITIALIFMAAKMMRGRSLQRMRRSIHRPTARL